MEQQVRVGVGAVITRGGQVLLMRRSQLLGQGTWSTPGGHLDPGETIVQCAIREAQEEVGLTQHEGEFLGITEDLHPDGRHYITAWVWLGEASGDPRLIAHHEADRLEWFAWDALPQPLFLPFARLLAGEVLRGATTAFVPSELAATRPRR